MALLVSVVVAPAFGAEGGQVVYPDFPTYTITDIGRPYRPIDGFCFFQQQTNPISLSQTSMFDSATRAANSRMKLEGRQVGADGVVGLSGQAMSIPNPENPKDIFWKSGMNFCGTFFKYTDTKTAQN